MRNHSKNGGIRIQRQALVDGSSELFEMRKQQVRLVRLFGRLA